MKLKQYKWILAGALIIGALVAGVPTTNAATKTKIISSAKVSKKFHVGYKGQLYKLSNKGKLTRTGYLINFHWTTFKASKKYVVKNGSQKITVYKIKGGKTTGFAKANDLKNGKAPKQNSANIFKQSSYYGLHEIGDSKQSVEQLLNKKLSVLQTYNAAKQTRNVSVLFYSKNQTPQFAGSRATSYLNVRTLKNGSVYLYDNHYVTGNFDHQYKHLYKGETTTLKGAGTTVKVTFKKNGDLAFKWHKNTLVVKANKQKLTLNNTGMSAAPKRVWPVAAPTSGNKTDRLVADAKRYLGKVPYRWDGRSPFEGLDCSSFMEYVWLETAGHEIGGFTGSQEKIGKRIPVSKAKKGDLLMFGKPGHTYHVGMASGNGKFIQESTKANNVNIKTIASAQPTFAVDTSKLRK